MNFKNKYLNKYGFILDKYQGTFLSTRIWNLFGYLVSFYFVATYLSQIEQGYYYTLNSLIALQVFFELGFSYVIVQKTSSLFSIWNASDDKSLVGNSYRTISSFFYYVIQWFLGCGVLLIIVLVVLGKLFFSNDTSGVISSIHSFWDLLVVLTSVNLIMTALLSFFEGFGKAIIVYRIKLFQSIAAQIVLWASIFIGLGIYSLLLSNLILFLVGLIFVIKFFINDIIELFKFRTNKFRYWFNNLFKFQSKVALSWISGYFQFQILVPIIFKYCGPVDAGKMGNTFSVVSGITALSMALIQSKSWEYSALIAVHNYVELNEVFKKHFLQAISVSLFVGTGLFAAIVLLNYLEFKLATKILPPIPFLLFIIATVLNVITGSLSIYLRAFLEEKLLVVSLLTGGSIISLLYFITPIYGLIGVALAYLGGTFVFGFLGSLIVYNKKVKSILIAVDN
jgi:hypothetical protein